MQFNKIYQNSPENTCDGISLLKSVLKIPKQALSSKLTKETPKKKFEICSKLSIKIPERRQ